jgi:DNA-binding beta-propeller fold protein YncE
MMTRRGLTLLAIVAAAGCATSAQPGRTGFLDDAVRPISHTYPTATSLVFEADQDEAAVNIYQTFDLTSNPAPIATIVVAKGCPYGLAVDRLGDIYVADNCGGNDVEEYALGQTTLKRSITNGISNPIGAAIDGSNRLYVSNYPAAISIYAHNRSKPQKIVSGSPLVNPAGLAVDKSGDLYIADYGARQVLELPAGSATVTPLNLQGLEEPYGIGIDQSNGYLWVTDRSGDAIDVYAPGQTQPVTRIPGNGLPFALSVQNRGKPKNEVAATDLVTHAVYAYDPNNYTLDAVLTNGIERPTGVLITEP